MLGNNYHLINFEKYCKLTERILETANFNRTPYTHPPIPVIRTLFIKVLEEVFDMETMKKMSEQQVIYYYISYKRYLYRYYRIIMGAEFILSCMGLHCIAFISVNPNSFPSLLSDIMYSIIDWLIDCWNRFDNPSK